MEEAAVLLPVKGVIGSVEVEHDLLPRLVVRLEEDVNEQVGERSRIVADL